MSSVVGSLGGVLGAALGGVTLMGVFSAALVTLICLLVIRVLLKAFGKILDRSKLTPQVSGYLKRGLKIVLYLIGAIIVCSYLGVDLTSLTALLSVLTLGLTLAAEDILGNVAGGLVLLSTHPFKIGDVIETGGVLGTVVEMGLNYTKLETANGQMVMIPSRTLSGSQMINYSTLGRRRIVYDVTASYDAPTDEVRAACLEAVAAAPGVLETPAPEVRLMSYGESSIQYSIRCWTDTADYWEAYFVLSEQLRARFAAHNVEMTYNHINVHMMQN